MSDLVQRLLGAAYAEKASQPLRAKMLTEAANRIEALERDHAALVELVREQLAIQNEEIAARPAEHGGELPASYLDTVAELCVRVELWRDKARRLVGK